MSYTQSSGDDVRCPRCGGSTWDNRLTKRNPKQPDFKCRDKNCDGVIWPPRPGTATRAQPQPSPNYGQLPGDDEQAEVEAAFVQGVLNTGEANAAEIRVQKLNALLQAYNVAFAHALACAKKAQDAGVEPTLEGVSAISATLFIQASQRGVV